MLTLSQYDKIAKKILRVHAPAFITNPDFLYHVTYEIMMADHLFDGTGTVEGYRKQRAQWKIYGLIKSLKRKLKNASEEQLGCLEYKPTEATEPINYPFLTAAENKLLRLKYEEGCTLEQIGMVFNITKQGAQQRLCQIQKKIKQELHSH